MSGVERPLLEKTCQIKTKLMTAIENQLTGINKVILSTVDGP